MLLADERGTAPVHSKLLVLEAPWAEITLAGALLGTGVLSFLGPQDRILAPRLGELAFSISWAMVGPYFATFPSTRTEQGSL